MAEHYSELKIKTSDTGSLGTEIFIDGHKIKGVRKYTLVHEPGQIPILQLDLNAFDLDIEEPAVITRQDYMGDIKILYNGVTLES